MDANCAPLIADVFVNCYERKFMILWHGISTNSRIPMGTNCAPLLADLFSYCYERDFMSYLHKSKRYDLIDLLKIPLDILTVYSPSIAQNLRNIFLIYIQQNLS